MTDRRRISVSLLLLVANDLAPRRFAGVYEFVIGKVIVKLNRKAFGLEKNRRILQMKV